MKKFMVLVMGLVSLGVMAGCDDDSKSVKVPAAVQAAFPHIEGEIRICDIGTIIASHCGPGTVAVFFLGDERPE